MMNLGQHPAAENILHLEQGERLLRQLTDEHYTDQGNAPFRGGVGSQFRHYIDFYDCFLNGMRDSRVDYSRRARDPRVESDRRVAAERIRELIQQLGRLCGADLESEVWVKSEGCAAEYEDSAWSRSTVHRELQFLASHTVHHHALIVSLLARQGVDCSPDFGVAPSTLRHWKQGERAVSLDAPKP